ncbi:MAG TPA: TolC family protein [Acidobacteriaceae bacterium]|nr:TolC family protein [Acidobacteriaceae bacterium]
MRRAGFRAIALAAVALAIGAPAQMSLTSAVDIAVRSHPKVRSAEADVARAQAALKETHDVFVPSLTAGAGLGQAYGYSTNPPTLFSVSTGSLVYNSAQMSYIRSARAGLHSAELALEDTRETVAQDTALAVLALQHDEQREQAIRQEMDYANALANIVQERLNGGQDTQMSLTQARLTAAQFRLALLRAQDETADDRAKLARMLSVPEASLTVDTNFPGKPLPSDVAPAQPGGYATAGIASAFANAEAKQQQARGDATFRYRPQLNLFGQYNRYATFSNSFKQLQQTYFDKATNRSLLTANEWFVGVQISVPLFDKFRADKARESAAVALKALHDAENSQNDALDGLARTRHGVAELQAQAEVAGLQQQLSQQQLDVIRVQLQNGTGNPEGPQMTPKDEQNARIAEREKYLGVIDANYQLHQTEIQLLRQTGQLLTWLRASGSVQAVPSAQSSLPPAPPAQH